MRVRHQSPRRPRARSPSAFAVYAAVSALAVSTAALSDEASQRARASGRTFYVSPSGSDRAAGGREDPFATLARARDAARAVRARATGPVTIVVRDGTY